MTRAARVLAALAFAVICAPRPARAWGERGHNAIARTAAMQILVGVDLSSMTTEDRASYLGLRDYYRSKALELGHLANIPDTLWRKLGPEIDEVNAPTHFLNAESVTDDIGSLSLDYDVAKADAAARKVSVNFFDNGTVIWRAQQLYAKMAAALKKAKAEEPGSKEFKSAVQEALVFGGLMAHFIGDASQPYHDTVDHDGYATNEGGIHSYFETAVLNVATPSLELSVYERAPEAFAKLRMEAAFTTARGEPSSCTLLPAACLARALAAQASARLGEVKKADLGLIIEPSVAPVAGHGGHPALRVSADAGAPVLRPIYEEQLALASAAAARLWRGAWESAGRPDLSKAFTFDYALAPDFVAPDYDPAAVARARGAKRR